MREVDGMIFFGQKFYGKVDHVPGLFFVATLFWYVQLIPLVPLGSYLILDEKIKDDKDYRSFYVGHSLKSILLGWARVGLLSVAVVCSIMAVVRLNSLRDQTPNVQGALMAGGVALTSWFLLWASYRLWSKASAEQAAAWAIKAGIDPSVVEAHFEAMTYRHLSDEVAG
jgi:hypothetical protein